jgi:RHS repeat-associated protein
VGHFNGNDSIAYAYGTDGLLSSLTVLWQNGVAPTDVFQFYWDGLGRRDSVVYSNQTYVSLGYDGDGHLRMVCSRHPSNPNVVDVLEHRFRYVNLTPEGNPLLTTQDAGGTGSPGCGSIPSGPYLSDPIAYEYDGRHQARRVGGWRYAYDASGNRVSTRFASGGLLDSTTYRTARNRILQTYDATPSLQKTFVYDGNGSLVREEHQSPSGNWRRYYYNTIGQMVWYESLELVTAPGGQSTQWIGTSDCTYDALGRRVRPCDAVGVGTMGFDGDTPIRGMGGYATPLWRWIHGPGLDDPLVGLNQVGVGNYTKYFYLTDGRGRNLAFTDVNGNEKSSELVYTQNGGKQSGAIDKSGTFDNGRAESPQTPHLAFYRNRYYDQSTGRFVQEDPIGPLGGLNLYMYAGNNPAVFTDPFGLCPPEWLCKMMGASAGQSAAEHYAEVAIDPSSSTLEKVGATAGGLLASLWTRDTYLKTGITLASAGALNAALKNQGGRAALALLFELLAGDAGIQERKRDKEKTKQEQVEDQRESRQKSTGCGDDDPPGRCDAKPPTGGT